MISDLLLSSHKATFTFALSSVGAITGFATHFNYILSTVATIVAIVAGVYSVLASRETIRRAKKHDSD